MTAAPQVAKLETWPIIRAMLAEKGIAKQHLDSYNEFISRGLQSIVDEVGKVEIEALPTPYMITFGKVKLDPPQVMEISGASSRILPLEARLRNLTYASPIKLELTIEEKGQPKTVIASIGYLPVMVKSNICYLSRMSPEQLIEAGEDPLDPGGYFIINGSERVIVGLEDLTPNKAIVEVEKVGNSTVYRARIHSSIVGFRAKLELLLKSNGSIVVKAPQMPTEIPLVILLKALGLEKDRDVAEAISLRPEIQEVLEVSFEEAAGVATTHDALVYLGNRLAPGMAEDMRIKKAENFLDVVVLPHIGREPSARLAKAYFLADAALKLLELKLGWIEPDDKDHYGNKVIKLAGQLLADIFRTAFRNLVADMKYQLERTGRRDTGAVLAAIRPGIITDKLANAIATGNWGRGRVGVTQLLDRTNYISTLSHLRRIQSPLSRSQPNFEARELHPTQFGRVCPVETPEGANVGLVKNLALSAIISVTVPVDYVMEHLRRLRMIGVAEASAEVRTYYWRVFLGGALVGYVEDGREFVRKLREMRRSGELNPEVNFAIVEPKDERGTRRIYINTGAGRVLRPLIVVKDGIPLLKPEHVQALKEGRITWQDLVSLGIIELLDADEEESCLVAVDQEHIRPETTHMELYPPSILGVAASLIPFPEHNQSPKNTYEAAMAKQSLGFPFANYQFVPYVRYHLLLYPQIPLTVTETSELLSIDQRPIGQECVVAVLSYDTYNVEDAIVVNKASLERGLGRSVTFRVYEAEAKQYLGGMKDVFEVPDPAQDIRGYKGERYYRFLEGDGIVSAEASLGGNDVLVGRTSPPRFIEEYTGVLEGGLTYRRDTSVSLRPNEAGIADAVFITETVEGNRLVKVRVRETRIPELGDKFTSLHGQKGVIGLIVPAEDLPYTEDGIVPDIIISSHAFPSRMTVGQFLESITGKAAALIGKRLPATAFGGVDVEEVGRILEAYGFKRTGKEVMYDGRTGKRLLAEVFVGLVYYQRLHHMVADKLHARARGQVQILTKQPTEGRSRGGGLRFGEMERDCLIAYGAAMALKDRLLDESDKTVVYVCENCGFLAYYDARTRRYICKLCGDRARISPVEMAYAFKLLLQELMSLAIAPRLILSERV
jgi:DNA-directed RNA polymerase subunit B